MIEADLRGRAEAVGDVQLCHGEASRTFRRRQCCGANSAPANLVRPGAFAGLASGDISATAYALHCTDDSSPFVAIWYGGTIVHRSRRDLGPQVIALVTQASPFHVGVSL